MALFQPTNVIPSTLSGEGSGTIDATEPLTVSWQINGNTPMTAYRIKIMQNDIASTLKLDTGKVTLASPVSGADKWGNPVPFSTVITEAQLAAAGIVNGYVNGYKMTIEQWWTTNDSVEQTSASYFITRTKPVVFIYENFTQTFHFQEYTFEAHYAQAQGDAVEWYRWELQIEADGVYSTVDDTGPIYGGKMVPGESIFQGYYGILYTYSGFVMGTSGVGPGEKYRVKCTVQTVNGVLADTGWKNIITLNITSYDPVTLNLCADKATDAVKISMPKNFPLMGNPTGTYDYTRIQYETFFRYGLNLPSGSYVTWGGSGGESLDISEFPYSIALKVKITDSSAETIYFTGSVRDGGTDSYPLKFSYDQNGFYIKFSESVLVWSTDIQPVNGATFSIALTGENVYFVLDDNGQIQSEETEIGYASWSFGTLDSVTVNGPGCFIDAWIVSGNMSYSTFFNTVVFNLATPRFTADTQFIALFYNTLYTGGLLIGGDYNTSEELVLTEKLGIYRRRGTEPYFHKVANIPLNSQTKDAVIYDYSALYNTEYQYYLAFITNHWDDHGGRIKARDGIGNIKPCFWNYTVLCCDADNNGNYIVKSEYRFALDVGSGNVGNNNNPSLQQNFTRYPLRQPVSNQYRSGTLTAYIGKAVNGQYVDTVGLMDELYALSSNGQTKFLKTRKGQIFQIETASPVSMNIGDKYAQQPAKISLPWVEVGDASHANILGESANIEGTPTFSVDPETMELMMKYSESSAMGENCFAMAGQDLYLLNPGVYNESDFSLNENMEVVLNTN